MNTTNKIIVLIVAIIIVAIGVGFLTIFDSNKYSLGARDSASIEQTPTLTNTTWVWREAILISEETISPKIDDVFTIKLTPDGKVSGTTDCNSFKSEYTTEAQSINFSSFVSTKMFCEGSQEQEYIGMLSMSTSYTFDVLGNLILIFNGDGGAMIFEPVI